MRHQTRVELPPVLRNEQGALRTVGFEIEFGTLETRRAANIIKEAFGGTVAAEAAQVCVLGTSLGDFLVKLDTRLGSGTSPPKTPVEFVEAELSTLARKAASVVLPQEIVSPPIPINRIEELDVLVPMLRSAGASGTDESLMYAFALHINPEAASLSSIDIAAVMKAFAMISPWLWNAIQPDMTRRLLGFAEPYEARYVEKLVGENYWPDVEQLIDDYIEANLTRDRDLDLLPLFAFLNEERVRAWLPKEKIGVRPTYHYRLPDARISDSAWSLTKEWNRWVTVERLAADQQKLRSACATYLRSGEDRAAWAAMVPELVLT